MLFPFLLFKYYPNYINNIYLHVPMLIELHINKIGLLKVKYRS